MRLKVLQTTFPRVKNLPELEVYVSIFYVLTVDEETGIQYAMKAIVPQPKSFNDSGMRFSIAKVVAQKGDRMGIEEAVGIFGNAVHQDQYFTKFRESGKPSTLVSFKKS